MRAYANRAGAGLLFVFSLVLGACDRLEAPLLAPDAPTLAASGSTLVECPVSETRSLTREIGLPGGTIELDGHRMTGPAGVLPVSTTFTLTAPKSNYVEIEIHADAAESFDFREPVTIAISYQRCTRTDLQKADLTAWQIDPATKALLDHMGGVDHKEERTVTFGSRTCRVSRSRTDAREGSEERPLRASQGDSACWRHVAICAICRRPPAVRRV